MKCELTLETLEEAMRLLPAVTYPKRIRVSYGDYQRMRDACDSLNVLPEQSPGVSLGFCREEIVPDTSISDNHYEVDW